MAHPSPAENSPSHDNNSENNNEETAHTAPSSGTPEEGQDERQSKESAPHSATEGSQGSDWLAELETLRALAYLVRDEKLSEIEIERGSLRISLKAPDAATPPPVTGGFGRLEELYAASAALSATNLTEDYGDDAVDEAAGAGTTAASAADSANTMQVVSPMVGIFYRAPSPSDPNFVEVGDHVEVGQTLGLVETMKVFNEITSEVDGTVIEITAQNGDLLETGDKLMVIRK